VARRRAFRRGSFGKRRQTDWEKSIASTLVSVVSGGVSSLGGVQLLEGGLHKPTIVRVRGCWSVYHQLSNIGIQQVGLGLMLLTDAEVAAGAFPGPITDADEDRWMWHWCDFLRWRGPSTETQLGGFAESRGIIDSKAMRIWEENFQLTLLAENVAVSGLADSIDATSFFRLLLKLA